LFKAAVTAPAYLSASNLPEQGIQKYRAEAPARQAERFNVAIQRHGGLRA
jgi:hypothetical protein